MTMFGEHLKAIIDANKINIYGFAKSAGLERTFIHKIISDDRIPSDDLVFKLMDALPLSPEERQRFLENFKIGKIGEFKYRQRIQVKNLVESIAHIEVGSSEIQSASSTSRFNISETDSTVIGYFAVNNLIKSVIDEATTDAGKQSLDFVIPDSYQYFYNELMACILRHPQMRIRHIIAFTKKIDLSKKCNENLNLISHTLPLAFAPGTGYCPYYFYKATNELELTQAMPYFILTASDRLILLNREFSKAAIICEKSIVSLYKDSFKTMLEQAKPLIKRLNSSLEVLGHLIDTDYGDTGEPYHWIEPEPCIGPLSTDEGVNQIIKQGIPNREMIVGAICKHYGFLRENLLRNVNVCTTEGLYRIISTGHVYYSDPEQAHPMSTGMIIEIMEILRDRIADGKVKLLFTNPSKITVPSKTLISINKKAGINLIMHDSTISDFRAVCFSEESINEAFVDFVESIEDSGLVCSEADSLATLSSILDELAP